MKWLHLLVRTNNLNRKLKENSLDRELLRSID